MKKKSLKTLNLSRSTVSNLKELSLNGGANSGALSCQEPVEPVTMANQLGCKDTKRNWCDSRFGGCNSYYCP